MDLNKTIRDLIDASISNPYAYNANDIKSSLMNYNECSEFLIHNDDLKIGLDRLYEYLGINEFSNDKSCLITNSVNGRIANALMDNIHIYCFDNDYYCSMASQLVNSEKNQKDKMEFLFGDISQFFSGEFNHNFLVDCVITAPSKFNETYKRLDSEMKYRQMNPYEYYTKRSIEFLTHGGICMSIVPVSVVEFVKKQILDYDKPISFLNAINFSSGYSFIYIKKL
jgi:hypothetical protein